MAVMVSAYSNQTWPVCSGLEGGGSPAVVVVAVDVQDLLALDTEHTVSRGVPSACGSREQRTNAEQALGLFTQKECIRSDLWPSQHCQYPDTTPSSSSPGRLAAAMASGEAAGANPTLRGWKRE